jgi:hypothetical protein
MPDRSNRIERLLWKGDKSGAAFAKFWRMDDEGERVAGERFVARAREMANAKQSRLSGRRASMLAGSVSYAGVCLVKTEGGARIVPDKHDNFFLTGNKCSSENNRKTFPFSSINKRKNNVESELHRSQENTLQILYPNLNCFYH